MFSLVGGRFWLTHSVEGLKRILHRVLVVQTAISSMEPFRGEFKAHKCSRRRWTSTQTNIPPERPWNTPVSTVYPWYRCRILKWTISELLVAAPTPTALAKLQVIVHVASPSFPYPSNALTIYKHGQFSPTKPLLMHVLLHILLSLYHLLCAPENPTVQRDGKVL